MAATKCGHPEYASGHCAEIACSNYINKCSATTTALHHISNRCPNNRPAVSVEKIEMANGAYFVGGHTVRIDHGRVIIGDVRSDVTLPVDELLAIAELIKEQTQ